MKSNNIVLLIDWCLAQLSSESFIHLLVETDADLQPNIRQRSGNPAEDEEEEL